MTARVLVAVMAGVVSLGVVSPGPGGAVRAAEGEKVTFVDHVLPIFRAKCNSCHDAGSAKGGLVLDNYGATMQGGASGAVVEESLDDSRLWLLITHAEQPIMPPSGGKLPDNELALIKQWFDGGVLETKESKPRMAKAKKSFALSTTEISTDKPAGPPPMPENLPAEPLTLSTRGNAITALAASPWAPLVAVAGYRQVLLYDTTDGTLAAVLPFPEGTINVLRFSRNGSMLLAAGGRGGQSGKAVVFDVKTGQRMSEVGNEPDAILAADISPNHGMVAVGGPKKLVRIYDTSNGELLQEIKKHTDWVTSMEFSPDGVLLATGDRSNGLFVWEANTGREFYNLAGHTGSVNAVSWRIDSNVLASASEDSTVRLWEMNGGSQIKSWGAHGGGASSVAFLRDGRIASTGRDRVSRLWDQNGAKLLDFAALPDVSLEVTVAEANGAVLAGDWTGSVVGWNAADGAEVLRLVSNPANGETRLALAQTELTQAQAAADAAAQKIAAIQKVLADRKAVAEAAQKALADGNKAVEAMTAVKAEADKLLAARVEIEKVAVATSTAATAALDQTKATKGEAEKALADAKTAVDAAIAAVRADKAKAEAGVADAVAKLKTAADQAVALKAAADKAVAAMPATPDEEKQLAAVTAEAAKAGELLAKRKLAVEKIAAAKGRAVTQPMAAAN
jgi:hypothetical protein